MPSAGLSLLLLEEQRGSPGALLDTGTAVELSTGLIFSSHGCLSNYYFYLLICGLTSLGWPQTFYLGEAKQSLHPPASIS